MSASPSAILLISCPDRKGIVAAVTRFISEHNGNILHLEQHVDDDTFFMRVEWDVAGFSIPRDQILAEWAPLQASFQMTCDLHFSDTVPRVAVFVSVEPHCLYDLLSRQRAGEWRMEIPLVISNHDDLRPVAAQFAADFQTIPITPATKAKQEEVELALLREHRIDFVVLARYMQIVGHRFIAEYPHRIINIHHSFLPAFPGAKPYHSAHDRGVKIIGATSHYVTAELDQGPIIEQDIIRVSHQDTVEDMVRKGRDLEKIVLARAVFAHLEHRVLVHRNRTVIFS
jgi:formyltetrahydrofolate deformylase